MASHDHASLQAIPWKPSPEFTFPTCKRGLTPLGLLLLLLGRCNLWVQGLKAGLEVRLCAVNAPQSGSRYARGPIPSYIKAPLCSLSHVKRPLSECKLNLSYFCFLFKAPLQFQCGGKEPGRAGGGRRAALQGRNGDHGAQGKGTAGPQEPHHQIPHPHMAKTPFARAQQLQL